MSALRDLRNVLVVGGGIGGMATAIVLARHGVAVDLIDVDPDWRVYGAGISISGPTFRAFAQLGVMDEMAAEGFIAKGLRLATADGTVFREIPADHGGSGGGIMRPVLHRILSNHVRAGGCHVVLGVTVDAFELEPDGVAVRFSDGREATYDLVVASDGITSAMRGHLFPDAPGPAFTGQGAWRFMTTRPPDFEWSFISYAGIKAGITPCGPDAMYLYSLQAMPGNPRVDAVDGPEMLRAHLAPFGGPIGAARDSIDAGSLVLYRPLEKVLLDPPWYRGRVLLIGDAAHATTPHLASGAGLAVEDALVLGEELDRAATVEEAFIAFMARRFDRCKLIVENSVRLGELEMAAAPDAEQAALMQETMAALAGAA